MTAPTRLLASLVLFSTSVLLAEPSEGQQNNGLAENAAKGSMNRDRWFERRDEPSRLLVQTKELTLHARAAPRPALKYRLLPDAFDQLPGNAVVYYLKAMGYLEQDPARDRISKYRKDAVAWANREGKSIGDAPPYVWLDTPPDELPLKEVKEYLQLSAFQKPLLREAARRAHFDLDRRFREVDDPIGYLLPEIQQLRSLARMQSLRCRVAIAENRLDDALETIGQQFALARHLGDDDFLVSNLVGIAIATIAWNDALYLVQHPKCPNLYWALTALPTPLVDMQRSMAVERQFLYLQLKVLKEVDETPRSASYWRDFVDRLLAQMGMLSTELEMPSASEKPAAARAAVVALVAGAYPGAKRYLITELKMPAEKVQAYPVTQVVFLAMVRFHDRWRDEVFKWVHVPFWQAHARGSSRVFERGMKAEGERYGQMALPTMKLLPAVLAARTAGARCDQTIALLRTIEAVRMYAAEHGKLPQTLAMLPVPAPIEPFTGKTIDYELLGDRAELKGHSQPGMRYRFILRIAEKP